MNTIEAMKQALRATTEGLEWRWESVANRAAPIHESAIDEAHTKGIEALMVKDDLSALEEAKRQEYMRGYFDAERGFGPPIEVLEAVKAQARREALLEAAKLVREKIAFRLSEGSPYRERAHDVVDELRRMAGEVK